MIPPTRFTGADLFAANEAWGANCGPGALAAIMGMTLDEIRPHMGDFEAKGYTNPTLMFAALDSVGRPWVKAPPRWPLFGLARIQWEGPWTGEGVPIRARYRHTHWVAAIRASRGDVGVFDINALGNGTGWTALADWESTVVPWILKECVPRATGGWHVTHAVEVH